MQKSMMNKISKFFIKTVSLLLIFPLPQLQHNLAGYWLVIELTMVFSTL